MVPCKLVAECAVSCRVLGAAFVRGRSRQRGRPGVPLSSATKGQRHWHTRAIRSIVKQNERPRCRPHTPNGRRRTEASS